MIVGLTGGIGSGKTTVSKIFEQLGIAVYDADVRAKQLLDNDSAIQRDLVALMGDEILSDKQINRSKMAEIVFANKDLLTRVNNIIHPAVAKDFKQWYKKQTSAYVLREAAILFESGSYKDCAAVITVFAEKELRVQRVMQRNQISRKEVEARMENQWSEDRKLELADYVIYNDEKQSVIKQVLDVHENLISKTNTTGR